MRAPPAPTTSKRAWSGLRSSNRRAATSQAAEIERSMFRLHTPELAPLEDPLDGFGECSQPSSRLDRPGWVDIVDRVVEQLRRPWQLAAAPRVVHGAHDLLVSLRHPLLLESASCSACSGVMPSICLKNPMSKGMSFPSGMWLTRNWSVSLESTTTSSAPGPLLGV